jgi:[ribosomal protein S18]-alanine N-acetyltransferase
MGFLSSIFARGEPALSDAGARDARDIAALHSKSFQRGWSEDEVERLLTERNVIAHRALVGKKLAGFILSRIAADEAEILSVAIDAGFQGRGLARRLLNLHLGRLAGYGVRTVFLEVGEANDPAAKLYARAGFREVSRRPNYYPGPGGAPMTALVLRRDLMRGPIDTARRGSL